MYSESDNKGLDQESIKVANRNRILDLLHKKRVLTKQEASQITDISFPTVSSNIDYLVDHGFAEEAGMADSTGGRKPVIYRFLPNARFTFGVNVEPGAIRIIRADLDIEIVDDFYFPFRKNENRQQISEFIVASIENIIEQNEIEKETVLGIGVVVPGSVNARQQLLEVSPTLGIKNLSFASIEKGLDIAVFLENEANAAALAEQKLGIARGMQNLVYISITQSVGAGVIIGNGLYRGAHNRAGEMGHQTIFPEGKECNCGKRGCWEQYVSELELLRMYEEERGGKNSSLKDFFDHLAYQDPTAIEVWDTYLNYMTLGIHNIVSVYDPHYIVIGGNIAAYPELLLPPLMRKVFGDSSFYIKNDTFILTSQLGKNSSIFGAALLPVRTLLSYI